MTNSAIRLRMLLRKSRLLAMAVPLIGLLLSVTEPCSAWVEIHSKKIIVKLPEAIESRFLVQIYRISNSPSADKLTHMMSVSEFQDARPAGSDIEIPASFDQRFYFGEEIDQRMTDTHFVRIIRLSKGVYQFKDFRTWIFNVWNDGDLILDGCRPIENAVWKPIQLSKEFTVHWVEANPGIEDYSGNIAIISGLPKSFITPQSLNKERGWRFKVAGIFYSEGGSERYYLEPIYKMKGSFHSRGKSIITSETLEKNNFSLEESSSNGD